MSSISDLVRTDLLAELTLVEPQATNVDLARRSIALAIMPSGGATAAVALERRLRVKRTGA